MKFFFKIFVILILINPFGFVIDNSQIGYECVTGMVFAQDGGDTGSGNSIPLENPLKDGGISDIPTFVEKLLEVVMKVGVPLVAVAIIYTGYLFISAQGNPEKLKKAKDAILYVFIGAIILLGAYVIAQALQGTINAIRGN